MKKYCYNILPNAYYTAIGQRQDAVTTLLTSTREGHVMGREMLRGDIEIGYNTFMSALYKRYAGQIKPELLRLYVLSLITEHLARRSSDHIRAQNKKMKGMTDSLKEGRGVQ